MIKTPPRIILIGVIVLSVILATIVTLTTSSTSPKCSLQSDGECFSLEVVDTSDSILKGLSGRQNLGQHEGMLFVFDKPGKYCFWMKEMNFSLDMIWLDEQKQVVKLQENVSPDTYPEDFCPDQPAKYVIEVNAGVANQQSISPGDKLVF